MKRKEKLLAKSREQRAESQKQRVIGDWSLVFGKHKLSGALSLVSHFLFHIPYFLFLSMRLKPDFKSVFSIRQLKLTAKDSAAMCLFIALSFAVKFIQRIKENNEYQISNTEFRSGANNIFSNFLSFISMRLAVRNRFAQSVPTSENSTVHNYKQFSFNTTSRRDSGAPSRQFRFAGYFLSINFLKMRELKQVLTKKVLTELPPLLDGEVGGGRICL